MPQEPAQPSAEDLDAARRFLRRSVAGTPRGWGMFLPGLSRVRVTHVEDGWVQLRFTGYDPGLAQALADDVLLPDAVLVARAGDDCTFEGFAVLEEPPPAPVPAWPPAGGAPPGIPRRLSADLPPPDR